MKKSILWSSIFSSIIGFVNMLVYIILTCLNVMEVRWLAFLILFGFFVVAWLPVLINLIFKIDFNLFILISYQVFLVLSLIVGSVWEVYGRFTSYDKIIHFVSGVLIALIAYILFKSSKTNKLNLFWLFLLVFSVSMMCGGLWEIWEFTTDAIFGNNAQVSNGLIGRAALLDTMIDIICDCAGGLLGGVAVVVLEKYNKKSNTNDLNYIYKTNKHEKNETMVSVEEEK